MQDDVAKILLHTTTILARLDELAHEITTDYRGKELTVVMVLNGALMLCADLLRRIPHPLKLDCISVSSYHGGTQTTGEVMFDQLSMPDINDRHVLIVDDILDSGLTLAAIVKKLNTECRPKSIKSCVLLRKKKDRLAAIDAEYIGFDIADEFVVGYGLDFDERYRNLPYIGVLRPEVYGV